MRYLPDEPFPAYSYVPGRFPHPTSDPRGHSYGAAHERETLDENRWAECRTYLRGIDLFNHGYYWEAHEAWESLWLAADRQGRAAIFLKGLIKLAAAGVKSREGRSHGVHSHAARASELLQAARAPAGEDQKFLGLDVAELAWAAYLFSEDQPVATADQPVLRVMPFELSPS